MRKPCSNSDLAQKNVPHSESFAVHALICKTLTNQGFADKKNSAFQQNCSKNGVPSLGAGDEESAEAPPAADEARRFRGSVPAVGCGSRRQPADTTVSAEAHTKKHHPIGWCFWSGRRGSNSLPGIPRMAVAIRRSPASPLDLTRFAQVEAASSPVLRHIPKRIPHPVGWGILFGAGDEARTRYLDLGKVALYQMSYARKRHRYCGTLVPPVGVEPTTRGFSVRCSTN